MSKLLVAFSILITIASHPASAAVHNFSASLAAEALTETVPFSFPPNDFAAADFEALWDSAPIPGVTSRIGKESFEWVRVSDLFLLPRGRILIEIADPSGAIEAANLANFGFNVAFTRGENGNWLGEMPVALLSEKPNRIRILIQKKDGTLQTGSLRIRFNPRPEVQDQRVIRDPQCSPPNVRVEDLNLGPHQFIYVGCRNIYSNGDEHPVSTLDLYLYWEGAGETLQFNGITTAQAQPQVWQFRLRAKPGTLDVTENSEKKRVKLTYRIAEHLHYGSLGLGLGPYHYSYQAPGASTDLPAVVTTLYGSYFFSDRFRAVMFNASALTQNGFSDTGAYLQVEQFLILDKRYLMRLMFGMNAMFYPSGGKMQFATGVPQGFELTVSDFWKKRHNLAAGAFIYPEIEGRSYYNVWLRWGSPELFGELNYISWKIPQTGDLQGQTASMRVLGISFGFPLGRFL